MPLPYGSYSPLASFAFTRSYVAGIAFSFDTGSSINQFGNQFTALSPGGDTFVAIDVADYIYAPSSNHYTLDYVITNSIYRNPPTGPDNPLPFLLAYWIDPADGYPWLVYAPFSTPGSTLFKFAFPPVTGQWNRFPWND